MKKLFKICMFTTLVLSVMTPVHAKAPWELQLINQKTGSYTYHHRRYMMKKYGSSLTSVDIISIVE